MLSGDGCNAGLTLQLRRGCLCHGAAILLVEQVHVFRHAGGGKTNCGDSGAVVLKYAPGQTAQDRVLPQAVCEMTGEVQCGGT